MGDEHLTLSPGLARRIPSESAATSVVDSRRLSLLLPKIFSQSFPVGLTTRSPNSSLGSRLITRQRSSEGWSDAPFSTCVTINRFTFCFNCAQSLKINFLFFCKAQNENSKENLFAVFLSIPRKRRSEKFHLNLGCDRTISAGTCLQIDF